MTGQYRTSSNAKLIEGEGFDSIPVKTWGGGRGGRLSPGSDGPANSQFCRGRRQQDLQNPPPVAHQAGAAIIQQ